MSDEQANEPTEDELDWGLHAEDYMRNAAVWAEKSMSDIAAAQVAALSSVTCAILALVGQGRPVQDFQVIAPLRLDRDLGKYISDMEKGPADEG